MKKAKKGIRTGLLLLAAAGVLAAVMISERHGKIYAERCPRCENAAE